MGDIPVSLVFALTWLWLPDISEDMTILAFYLEHYWAAEELESGVEWDKKQLERVTHKSDFHDCNEILILNALGEY